MRKSKNIESMARNGWNFENKFFKIFRKKIQLKIFLKLFSRIDNMKSNNLDNPDSSDSNPKSQKYLFLNVKR